MESLKRFQALNLICCIGKKMKKTLIVTTLLLVISAQSFATPPKNPVITSEVEGTEVSLSWTKEQNAAGYALYYVQAPFAGLDDLLRVDLGDTNSLKAPLFPGASYYATVTSYNTNREESGWSNIERIDIEKIQMVSMALNRYQYNNVELKEGSFEVRVDVDQKIDFSTVELFAPSGDSYGQLINKGDNQAELFITEDLSFLETFLLEGAYSIKAPKGEKVDLKTIESGSYPSFPEIIAPTHNATDLGINPTISFKASYPTCISITDVETNKEVFFSRHFKYTEGEDGVVQVKIDGVDLKPDTRYLLEINETNPDVAKGSTSIIAFSTQ
jgi:hypothetical protein